MLSGTAVTRKMSESTAKVATTPGGARVRGLKIQGRRSPTTNVWRSGCAAPGVVATFAVLSLIFRVTAVPDNIYRGLGAMRRRVTWTLFRPRLARKYRRGDGLDVAHNRRYSR